jgi:hypothetical protein
MGAAMQIVDVKDSGAKTLEAMPAVTWLEGNPPAVTRKSGGGKIAQFVKALEARPGTWAEYDVSGLKHPRMAVLYLRSASPNVEAVSRSVGGAVHVYARFVK